MNSRIKRNTLLAAAFAASVSQATAQDRGDALRYSFLQPQGTARSIGFGSALGSVGGDFSSLSVNPAGIGIYRRSELMITPSLIFSHASTDFAGNTDDGSAAHFSISNIGLVATTEMKGKRKEHSGWNSVSFGFGLTRLADFTRDYSYEGKNTTSSGSAVFAVDANIANHLHTDDNISLGDLGYQTYLLDTANGQYISVVHPSANSPVSQQMVVKERGGISEMSLTLGGNYQEKLMLGATLGIPILRYVRDKTYSENDLSGNANNNFNSYSYTENLKTTGTGINLKLGAIYKISDNFRLGAALHTPSYFSLTDIQDQSVTADVENFAPDHVYKADALQNRYTYNLLTPWRGIFSGTVMLGQYGFITADYEYVDYSSARFNFDDVSYQRLVNNDIKSTYQGASNVRAGLEIRLDNFQIRGGFGYYGSPYKNSSMGGEHLDFSGGFGFRFQNAFIDLGFVHHQYKNSEQPYQLPTDDPASLYYGIVVPTANINNSSNNAVATFGVKF